MTLVPPYPGSGWSGAEGPGRKIWGGSGGPPPGTCASAPLTAGGYYPPVSVSGTIIGVAAITGPDGVITYDKPGDGAPATRWDPAPGFSGGWHFPNYHLAVGTNPSGFYDAWGTLALNSVVFPIVGDGTLTIYPGPFLSGGVRGHYDIVFSGTGVGPPAGTDASGDWTDPATPIVIVLTGGAIGNCYHQVTLGDGAGNGGGAIGFGGFTWAPV